MKRLLRLFINWLGATTLSTGRPYDEDDLEDWREIARAQDEAAKRRAAFKAYNDLLSRTITMPNGDKYVLPEDWTVVPKGGKETDDE